MEEIIQKRRELITSKILQLTVKMQHYSWQDGHEIRKYLDEKDLVLWQTRLDELNYIHALLKQ